MSSAPGNESAASKLANTAGEAAANIPRTGVSGKRWLAILGAGALIVSGSVFAYNSLHKEEEAFTADGGEEFAQVNLNCRNWLQWYCRAHSSHSLLLLVVL